MTKEITNTKEDQSIMKFPMIFPIKIIGINDSNLPDEINKLILNFDKSYKKETLKKEFSKTKKYIALTVTINAQSKEQLDNLYRALTAHPKVKVVL